MISLRNLLYRFYWKAESLIAPELKSSQYCYFQRLRSLVPGKVWLDLGCGGHVFGNWMTSEQAEVVENCKTVYGLDMDWPSLKAHKGISNKAMGDIRYLPIRSDSVNVVSANMVVEHLREPELVLGEIHRVLRQEGFFVLHTPNSAGWPIKIAAQIPERFKKKLIWVFEGRRGEDVFPTHYRMNTDSAIRQLAAKTQFEIEDMEMVSTSAATAMLGPLVLAELLYIRRLQSPRLAQKRSNIVAILKKVGK